MRHKISAGELVEMPKPDEPVLEVRCYKTGKPLPKVPQWLATVNVKFVSDEARQKEPPLLGILDGNLYPRLPILQPEEDVEPIPPVLLGEEELGDEIEPEELEEEIESVETLPEADEEELDL